ncbi:hypothetical protein BYT27DRAFT_6859505 [Phlegmacium glaucopus]|nr:hypothetical protein BYT27DRAFT_6859505 [Phlegmacium glaucopus]
MWLRRLQQTLMRMHIYPSPTSSSKPSLPFISQASISLNCIPPLSRLGVRVVASYRPLSTPISDLPVPSYAMDIRVEIDHQGSQLHYPDMKRLSLQ